MNDDAPSPEAPRPAPGGLVLRQNLAAVASGVLVVLSFPRYGDVYGLDFLILVSLVPLFLAARGVGWRRGLALGYLSGLVIEGAGFLWVLHAIREFSPIGPVLSAVCFGVWLAYTALPWGLLGAALGRGRRPVYLYAALLFWIALEALVPRLFTWHFGGALYARSAWIQCVDLLGASGLTAWVLLVNVSFVLLILWRRGESSFPWRSTLAASVLAAAILGYGTWRIQDLEAFEAERPEQRVMLVQGAVDPRGTAWSEHTRPYRDSFQYYLAVTRAALERREGPSPSLLVWPEGIDNTRAFAVTPGIDPWLIGYQGGYRNEHREALLSLLSAGGGDARRRALVFGGSGKHVGKYSASNVGVLLKADGIPRFYEKNRLMPFGEWTPFVDQLEPSTRESLGLFPNRIRGVGNPLLELPDGTRFRQLICYEAVIPDYVRRAALGADLLVNLTEDSWYGDTAHIPQHVSVLRLRVVENRTPLVRATNIGPSGVIDILGRFRSGSAIYQPEVVLESVRPGARATFYQSYGHYAPVLALLLAVALSVLAARATTGREVAGTSS